jgi:beta-mannosidase
MTTPTLDVQAATLPASISLDGVWRLLPVDSFRQGFYPLDDDSWIEQHLPAHWQQHPLLERYIGKMVYRKRFPLEGLRTEGRGSSLKDATTDSQSSALSPRYWLRLNGVFYWHQPYFNGVDLGQREGYFMAHEYEVTPWVAEENTLVVEVDCPEEHDKLSKRMITGVFSHWDCLDPETNPGGIWLPVELIATGPVRVGDVLLHPETLSEAKAAVRFRATLDAAKAGSATLRWTFAPKNFAGEVQVIEQRHTLAQGQQELAGLIDIRDPRLWWTHDMGDPNCYTVTLAVVQGGAVSDERSWTFGLRRFEMRNWIAYLNGVRMYIKGNNYAPGDTRLATMTRESYENDLRMARECNLNLLRTHAHVEHPAFYEAADTAGLLVWQDFPLQWLYRREILPIARQQVRQMARLLYNHPAVAIWCMHNEALYVTDTTAESIYTQFRVYLSVLGYNWNRDTLDTQLKRDVGALDRTRPIVRSSGEFAIPFLQAGTDTHFYMGWYTRVFGPLRFWERLAQRLPANIRFVSEFGAQSFPNLESCLKFMDADATKINWDRMTARHQFQPGILEHSLPWREIRKLDELIQLTQSYQIAINRFYVDRLRAYKYRPTGGIIPFMFHDPNPAISFSIVDYWRTPKRSYAALRLALSPQYVFALLAQDHYPVGQPIDLPIHVVNDHHRNVPVELVARLLGPDGTELAHVSRSLTLPADCMALEAERLRLTPDTPGVYHLRLELHGGVEPIDQEYAIVVEELHVWQERHRRRWWKKRSPSATHAEGQPSLVQRD